MHGLTSCYFWGPVFLLFPSCTFYRIPLLTAARMRIPPGDLSSSSSYLSAVVVGAEIWRRNPSEGKGMQSLLSCSSTRNLHLSSLAWTTHLETVDPRPLISCVLVIPDTHCMTSLYSVCHQQVTMSCFCSQSGYYYTRA